VSPVHLLSICAPGKDPPLLRNWERARSCPCVRSLPTGHRRWTFALSTGQPASWEMNASSSTSRATSTGSWSRELSSSSRVHQVLRHARRVQPHRRGDRPAMSAARDRTGHVADSQQGRSPRRHGAHHGAPCDQTETEGDHQELVLPLSRAIVKASNRNHEGVSFGRRAQPAGTQPTFAVLRKTDTGVRVLPRVSQAR
jgi:hypothetical protein